MLDPDTLRLRHDCVVSYLADFALALERDWFDMAASPDLTLPRALLLCHRMWLRDEADVDRRLGLGSFPRTRTTGQCQATVLWGYECHLEFPLQQDHLFPAALGGPAVNTNHVWLCSLHNGWKGADLTAYPWERGWPDWLSPQLERMRDIVHPDVPLAAL